MCDSFGAVRQSKTDTRANDLENIVAGVRRDIFPHDVATEWKRQTRPLLPPRAEVDNLLKTGLRERELSFVNDQANVGAPVFERVENLIERHDHKVELSDKKLEREIRARHLAGDCNHTIAQPFCKIEIVM